MSPTYELAIQTGEVAAKMSQFCPEIKIRFAVRGEDGKLCFLFCMFDTLNVPTIISVDRKCQLTDHIIIGTPGKMLDWGTKFKVFDLKKITVFVLDEADVMIDTQGHQDQCIRIHK